MDKVPVLSIICMILSCLIALAIPVGLFLWLRLRKKADVLPFFIGCAVMFLFALTLEALIHQIILESSLGTRIRSNPWSLALYGGIMAGLFEESGRFLAMKTVLRRYLSKDINALMYGAGHGGFEAVAILGNAMMNNILYSILINLGLADTLTSLIPADAAGTLTAATRALVETPSWQFLAGGLERISAVVLHLALSVYVWHSAGNLKKLWLFPLAFLIHAAADIAVSLLSSFGVHLAVTESVIALTALLAAVGAAIVWKQMRKEQMI